MEVLQRVAHAARVFSARSEKWALYHHQVALSAYITLQQAHVGHTRLPYANMCLPEKKLPKTPRSPFRRLQREILKPKLSRKVVSSARVNLNTYWAQFETILKKPLEDSIQELSEEIQNLGN